jgi:hypothetical protein
VIRAFVGWPPEDTVAPKNGFRTWRRHSCNGPLAQYPFLLLLRPGYFRRELLRRRFQPWASLRRLDSWSDNGKTDCFDISYSAPFSGNQSSEKPKALLLTLLGRPTRRRDRCAVAARTPARRLRTAESAQEKQLTEGQDVDNVAAGLLAHYPGRQGCVN